MTIPDTPTERFARALTFPTVSARIGEPAIAIAFTGLIDYLLEAFPALASASLVTRNDPWQLVLELPGDDSSLDPILLLAHYDVVDVANPDGWSHEPFGGEIDAGYVWGRGALDDKNVLVALLEAAEAVVRSGARFERGLVLAFGGDEELSGRHGAGSIADRFAREKRRFHFVLDEGAVIAVGMIRTPKTPIALIGVAEKGHANVVISAETRGGHAAMPPTTTALGIVARTIAALERSPFRARLIAPVAAFFRAIGAATSGPLRLVYRHPRLFWPLLRRVLAASPATNALVRTTQAMTMAQGSGAPNVLPQRARAVANVRILPGERVGDVLARYRALTAGEGVSVSLLDENDAHDPVAGAPLDHPAYAGIERAVTELVDCVPAPYLVTGATDSRWYAPLAEAVFRFIPMALTEEEIGRIHGTDERLSLVDYERMIAFYRLIIERECTRG